MARSKSFELVALDLAGSGLRTVFSWTGERYSQTIFAVADGEALPLIESDSAPWQEIVPHSLPNARPALLLTGAGEGRYWSATVESITDRRLALLGFNLACRRGKDAAMPALVYRVPVGVTVGEREGCVTLALADRREFQISPAAMPTSIAAESVETSRFTRMGEQITIEALGATHVSTRHTVQWRFELSAVRQT